MNGAAVKHVIQNMEEGSKASMSEIGVYMPPLYMLAATAIGPVVELGVGSGYSTLPLLLGALDAGTTLTSYDIDRNAKTRALTRFGWDEKDSRLKAWRFMNRLGGDGSQEWKDGTVGLFFDDASHGYEETKKELEMWLPKLHSEGVMCGHDYYLHLPKIGGEDRWAAPRALKNGVFKAVNEFAERHKDRFELQAIGPYDWGFFILWPRKSG